MPQTPDRPPQSRRLDDGWTRRHLLGAGAATAISLVGRPIFAASVDERKRLLAQLEKIPLERLDPFGSPERYRGLLRPYMHDPELGKALVERLWSTYQVDRKADHAEWSFLYLFIWWRSLPTTKRRLRIAEAGRKMTDLFMQRRPEHPAGYTWGAVFLGLESITRGVLNALNLVPAYRQRLERAEAIDPKYYYGLSKLLQAKLYTKLPPFPVSFGDVRKAPPFLDAIEPLCRGVYPTWYLTYAEADLQIEGREAAFAWLDRMQEEVDPGRVHLAYDLEVAKRDARSFRQVVRDGTYDKYTWDPVTVLPESS